MKSLLLVILTFFPLIAVSKEESARYIFFLHNKFLEEQGLDDSHPDYGKCEYREIIGAFQTEGFTVISEIRPRNTDAKQYAQKVTKQVDSLLKRRVPPGNITVIGTSKGSYIAWFVSSYLKNKDVNFVFIGACSESLLAQEKDLNFCGNILSIYERSDVLGQSCNPFKAKSTCTIPHYKEIELNTGLKHGFLYKASTGWIAPSVQWAKQQY